ncbi:IS110 family transposase [Paenibacillus sp. HB172176]|uniref:IS110 family transposase n=1 Tax=Paenibacillus sp. HB172176 TaxID=2493690 RepID=UPI00143ADE3B|nr:IS110 family transposase [Paenibacillus sp. HB172176]
MKFKRKHQINQRIARITPNHLVVGIDIAKEIHVASAVNYRGQEVGSTCSFTNDQAGFEKLMRWVKQQYRRFGLTQSLFGMESTGHYGSALAQWLLDQGQEVVQVNPVVVKRNKENRDNRPSKNDAKDAVVIADTLSRGYYHEWVWHEENYRRLRCIVNEYEALSIDLTAIGNRLQRLLDEGFPEFTQVFKRWDCPRAIATLQKFPLPEDLQGLSVDEVMQGWHDAGMTRSGGARGRESAARLLAAAHSSIGITATATELRRQIQRQLKVRAQLLADQIQVMEEVHDLLQQLPEAERAPLAEIGLSPWLSATVLANTGPLQQYAHGQQVLALAGLSLCENQSGKRRGQVTISKRGRRQLRKYLYLAMLGLVKNHPAFREWHAHYVQTCHLKKQTSIFKLIGKLLRILVALAHSGDTFSPKLANTLQTAA